MIALFLSTALAADLPSIAEREGWPAVARQLDRVVLSTKRRKLGEALEALGLDKLRMPVEPFLGAELDVGRTGASRCTWKGGTVSCTVAAEVEGEVGADEYGISCRSSLGAMRPHPVKLEDGGPGAAVWTVREVEACWALDGEFLLHPAALGDLQGIGEGTEFIPPELTGITRDEAEEAIEAMLPQFKHCLVREGSPGLTGSVEVRYHIAEDGSVSAEVEKESLGEPAVVACILRRFGQVQLPPRMDGYEGGTYPFTFR